MRKQSLAVLAGLIVSGTAAVSCWAGEAPQPQPIVPDSRVAAIKAGTVARATVVASPTMSQTTVVRMPDGSLGMVCEQKRNPAAAARTSKATVPEQQQ